ncbi:hypothetical protein EX895_004558 [Sporisorium graminicola]|uniref:Pre-mRNA-splicing factor CWC24 n=1 Tax=Sporisorium graminicola TaxID=280036 RepID=A0A4V6EV67_9BASI|nr:hypothetical protein EX895_004558 [Sporisorium graminicola]TKY86409.1 hypothetical protein EX895_004558 [Sporisorium graminicola]
MDATPEIGGPSAPPPTVVFKRKRGPAARATTSINAAASSSTASSSSNSVPGPSRISSRNRSGSDSDPSDSESSSAVVIKKKRSNNNPLVQSTGSVYRKSKLGRTEDDDDDSYSLEEGNPTSSSAYLSRTPGSTGASSTNASSLQKIRDDATRHSDWDLDTTPSSSEPSRTSNADGLYRGAKSYTSYVAARDDGSSSKMRSRGPIRQTTTVRTTSLMDYQPDICKDYKETGYCGFGDTCKFLHDRSDYLAGWQLDVLPNSAARSARETLLSDPESDKEEDEVPFACLICRQPFTDPVVTRCGHYFCEACAIGRFARNSKCFACGQQTGGLFNSAKNVLAKMEAVKRRKAQARTERQGWLVQDEQPISEIAAATSDDDGA